MEKATTLPADIIILDLEDAVAPEVKAAAREAALAAIAKGGLSPRQVVLRINSLGTPWGNADLAGLAAAAAMPDAVLIPKVQGPEDIAAARSKLAEAGVPAEVALWAMMETPLGILNAAAIALAPAGPNPLAVFVMGTNDLAKETRASLAHGRVGVTAWLSTAVAAARAGGLGVLDGVFNALDDEPGFAAECAQGRALGMDGKTLIHPRQIEGANAAFGPTAQETAAAEAILAAFAQPENAGKGAISLNGRMVERLHADIARETLALVAAIAARNST